MIRAATHTPALFAPMLMVLAALTGCEAEPDANAAAAAPQRSRGDDAALVVREKAQTEWLKRTLETPGHAAVYEAALEQARGRADHCSTDRCRSVGQQRRDSRLDFAEGQAATVDNLPFESGQFARMETGFTGPVRIVPLIDGRAMLVVSLSFKGKPACALDGVMTKDDNGTNWTVSSLEEGLPTLVLKPRGDKAFDLAYADAGHQPNNTDYCGAGTAIDGRYTIAG
ncbi:MULTISPECIES: hypothetical protein [unclassified Novosphingobium]|uniref:hypothetical protein n=1 Tax=unclassified Novosphingobium TaxID=2644732 RepID=UPI0013599265|nr:MULTISPECIES: hypothetical protein [unclassified Novosphingobium]